VSAERGQMPPDAARGEFLGMVDKSTREMNWRRMRACEKARRRTTSLRPLGLSIGAVLRNQRAHLRAGPRCLTSRHSLSHVGVASLGGQQLTTGGGQQLLTTTLCGDLADNASHRAAAEQARLRFPSAKLRLATQSTSSSVDRVRRLPNGNTIPFSCILAGLRLHRDPGAWLCPAFAHLGQLDVLSARFGRRRVDAIGLTNERSAHGWFRPGCRR